jgi:iron complex transport system permease protein
MLPARTCGRCRIGTCGSCHAGNSPESSCRSVHIGYIVRSIVGCNVRDPSRFIRACGNDLCVFRCGSICIHRCDLASIAVFTLSAVGGKITSTKLVLSGVIIASLCGAFSNLIVYLAPNATQMRDLTFWLMGSLSTTGFDTVVMCAVPLVICIVFFLTQLRNLNAMMLGDDTATTLGINLSTLRKAYILITAFMVAILVCNCGLIGFVGLIIPHIGRALVGTNHWKLYPISILLGAIFMMVADIFARSLTVSEIPIGIITAICGAPVFAYIMIKKSYSFGAGS